MRLLIVAQAVDSDDPVLGFFTRWIEELATRFDGIEVVCLKEGAHVLPGNVRVHSLGKERGRPLLGSLAYAFRFLWRAWTLRDGYDAVFVHMNQEYILIAGWLWKLLGKPVYLWRNHYAGSWRTRAAAAFCMRVFYTSDHSYTARFKNAERMPVGIDTKRFRPDPAVVRKPRSILFLARMAPSKRAEVLIDALLALMHEGVEFAADFVGSPLSEHERYYEALKARAKSLGERAHFFPAVPNRETPPLYQSHEIFVNTSPSGMLDKTLFEAVACGCRVLATSEDFAQRAGALAYFADASSLAHSLRAAMSAGPGSLPDIVARESLSVLGDRLVQAMRVRQARADV